MWMRLIRLACAATLLAPWSVFALDDGNLLVADSLTIQELRDYYGDEMFITIATGSRKPIYKAPAVATVITAEEIKAMGARSLDEVLETVAGLHVVPSNQGRLDSVYSIRGIHTSFNPHVLTLVNGIPFPHFSGGRPFQFRMPVSSISRIEVIRGPGSAVYGADAFSGVINIITKDAWDIGGTEIGGRVGSFNTHDLWLQHGKTWGLLDVSFSLEWQKSDGDRKRLIEVDQQSLIDPSFSLAPGPLDTRYDVVDAHLNLKYDNWRFRHWFWRQHDAGLGAGSALALDPFGGEDITQNLTDITYSSTDVADNLELNANFHYLHRQGDSRFVLFPPGATVLVDGELVTFPEGMLANPSGRNQGTGFDISAIHDGLNGHRFRLGFGVRYEKFEVTRETKNFGPGVVNGVLTDVTNTEYVFLPDSSRTVYFLSLQDEWQFARDWEVTAGLRYDHYSDFGNTFNPRVALVWAVRHNLTTKLLYGRAFRAPSFIEQFSINNPVALGNPNLDPETIDTIELAFDYRPTFDLSTSLSFFSYRAQDLIEFMPDPLGTRTARNARDQDGYGFEIEMDWRVLDTLRLRGNYAWQRSEDADTKQRIADAPGQQVYLAANWNFLPDWTIYPQYRWIGSRKRSADDPRSNIDDYSLVDLTLRRYRIMGYLDFALAIRNVFDEHALEPSTQIIPGDYPLERRHFWGEVSYRF